MTHTHICYTVGKAQATALNSVQDAQDFLSPRYERKYFFPTSDAIDNCHSVKLLPTTDGEGPLNGKLSLAELQDGQLLAP